MIVIINKIEYINNQLLYTPIGYTEDQSIVDSINQEYDLTLGDWIDTNISSLSNGYSADILNNNIAYIARTYITNDSISELPLITNLNQLT